MNTDKKSLSSNFTLACTVFRKNLSLPNIYGILVNNLYYNHISNFVPSHECI